MTEQTALKPIEFEEVNQVLTKPKNMSGDECGSLPIFYDGVQCVSCWNLKFMDKIRVLLYGKIWLGVMSQSGTQPPVYLVADKTVFLYNKVSVREKIKVMFKLEKLRQIKIKGKE